MKIQKFIVTGLHGNKDPINLSFNNDLNILSGRNGSGKTTILKLMWYLISGNADKAAAEITFESAIIETNIYKLSVKFDYKNEENPLTSNLEIKNNDGFKQFRAFETDESLSNINIKERNKIISWFLTQYAESSFFMPTFRIIEGGFTTEKYDFKKDILKQFYLDNANDDTNYADISTALKKLSSSLSKKEHKFVTTISAKDIDIFLVKKYAEIMKKVNHRQEERVLLLSEKIKFILEKLKDNKEAAEEMKEASKKLDDLEAEINELNRPLNLLRSSIKNFINQLTIIFDEKIYFTHTLKPKDADMFDSQGFFVNRKFLDINGLDSFSNESETLEKFTINSLSAGEKQILTFLAYNIFYNNTIFFIDEPELSLHVDWQSKLFSLLKEQNPSNQFIISTHSPFIYSLFPDKEIILNDDRGCQYKDIPTHE